MDSIKGMSDILMVDMSGYVVGGVVEMPGYVVEMPGYVLGMSRYSLGMSEYVLDVAG